MGLPVKSKLQADTLRPPTLSYYTGLMGLVLRGILLVFKVSGIVYLSNGTVSNTVDGQNPA